MKPTRDGKRKHIITKSTKTKKGITKRATTSPPPKLQKFEPVPRIEPKFINTNTIPSTFSNQPIDFLVSVHAQHRPFLQDRPFHISSSVKYCGSNSYISSCHPEFQPLGRFPIESEEDEESLNQFDQSNGISFSESSSSQTNISISPINEYPLKSQHQIIKISHENEEEIPLSSSSLMYNLNSDNCINNTNYNDDENDVNNNIYNDNNNEYDNPKPITFTNRKETVFDRNKKVINKPQIITKKYSNTATSPVKLFYEENKQKNYEKQQLQLQQQEKRLIKETVNNLSYTADNNNNNSEYGINKSKSLSNENENNLIDSLLPIFSDFEIDYNTIMSKYNNINSETNISSPSSIIINEKKDKDKRMSPISFINKNENILSPFVEDILNEALFSIEDISINNNNSLSNYK